MPGVSRLPLIVRTSADVSSLLANSRHVRKLPESGLKIAVVGLDAALAEKLSVSIERYVKACGCAAGGVFVLVSLAALVGGIALLIAQRGPRWSDLGLLVLGVLGALLLGGIGKLFGLMQARWRFERKCREVILSLQQSDERNGEVDR
ncbi:hypothetical protein [Variovorax sp. LjRoot178]|uniref:hypothetical protein n=1 Tax=Variovorax sp. LjRoot178 TaxID=3342277 RepID=UPI003ECDEF8D